MTNIFTQRIKQTIPVWCIQIIKVYKNNNIMIYVLLRSLV